MKGQEIIDYLVKTNMQDKEVSVNFSFNGNGAYVAEIKNICWDADEFNTFIDIGLLEEIIDFKELKPNKCDICGEPFLGRTYEIYDENYNKQQGLVQCEKCYSLSLHI